MASKNFRRTCLAVHFEKARVVRLGQSANGVAQIEDMDDSQLGSKLLLATGGLVDSRSAPGARKVELGRYTMRLTRQGPCAR